MKPHGEKYDFDQRQRDIKICTVRRILTSLDYSRMEFSKRTGIHIKRIEDVFDGADTFTRSEWRVIRKELRRSLVAKYVDLPLSDLEQEVDRRESGREERTTHLHSIPGISKETALLPLCNKAEEIRDRLAQEEGSISVQIKASNGYAALMVDICDLVLRNDTAFVAVEHDRDYKDKSSLVVVSKCFFRVPSLGIEKMSSEKAQPGPQQEVK